MTKKTSDIDELFRNKFQNFESIPESKSWKEITEKLDQQDREKSHNQKKLWYYSAAAIFILTLASFIVLRMLSDTSNSVEQPIATNTTTTTTPKKENKTTPIIAKKDSVITPQVTTPVPTNEIASANTKKEFTLPDGSSVVLNRNSKLKYPNNFSKERIVYLSGEAFFKVKSDPSSPFSVYSNLSVVKVLGTSFTVRSYKKELFDEINVIEGKVSFGKPIEKGNKIVILAGNKGIIQGQKGPEQAPIKNVNYDSWLTEKIVFKNTELKEVLTLLESYYNVSVSVNNPEILRCKFTGTFESSDINEILQVLSISFNLSYDKDNKNYVLSGKGCQ